MTTYKKYEFDPSVPVPARTLGRENKSKRTAQRSLIEELNPELFGKQTRGEDRDPSLETIRPEVHEPIDNDCGDSMDTHSNVSSGERDLDPGSGSDTSSNTTQEESDSASATDSESESDSALEIDDFEFDFDIPAYEDDADPYRFKDLQDVLCKCTPTRVGEAIVMVLSIGMRNNFTWVGMVQILKMINVLFARRVLPDTKYLFLKYLDRYNEHDVIYHNFCVGCALYLGKGRGSKDLKDCPCGRDRKLGYFLTLGIQKQLENLLKKKEIVEGLQYGLDGRRRQTNSMSDIFDGEVYRNLSKPGGPLHNNHNLTFTLNTDGIEVGKSSKRSMWPIFAVINELPPKLRVKNKILCGVWVSDEQPDMSIFLKPFVEEVQHLAENGVSWQYQGQNVTSQVFPVCACVDSPARCKILNFRQYHGRDSCTFCYHPGDRVEGLINLRYSAERPEVPPLRTHDEIESDMMAAFDRANGPLRDRIVRGVKGPSPLMFLPHFDMANMVVPDIMHMFKLVQTMMIRFSNEAGLPFFLTEEKMTMLSSRYTSVKPPKSITRSPRPLSQLNIFTCSELRSWLILYAPVLMKGILPVKFLAHFSLFSSAIRLLSKKSVTMANIQKAHSLLVKFVVLYEEYYGLRNMTYNVHLLTHLCASVVNFGPLWNHDCFCYETENRHILQMQSSPYAIAEQVIRKFLCRKNIDQFCIDFGVAHEVKDFVDNLNGRRHKYFVRSEKCVLLGQGKAIALSEDEHRSVSDAGLENLQHVTAFEEMYHGSIRLTTAEYCTNFKFNDSVVVLQDGSKVEIQKICQIQLQDGPRLILFVRELVCSNSPVIQYHDIVYTDAQKVTRYGCLRAVSPQEIVGQCVVMCPDGCKYVTEIPFGCYGD